MMIAFHTFNIFSLEPQMSKTKISPNSSQSVTTSFTLQDFREERSSSIGECYHLETNVTCHHCRIVIITIWWQNELLPFWSLLCFLIPFSSFDTIPCLVYVICVLKKVSFSFTYPSALEVFPEVLRSLWLTWCQLRALIRKKPLKLFGLFVLLPVPIQDSSSNFKSLRDADGKRWVVGGKDERKCPL